MDLNTDPGCGRTMDPAMMLDSSPGPDVIMTLVGISGHQDPHGPSGSMAFKSQHVPKVTS